MKKFLLLSHICGTFWRIYGWLPGWFPCQCKPVTQLSNALLYIIGPGISGMTIAYARWLIRNFGALVKFTVDYSAINEYMYVYIMESVLEARLEFVWIEPKDFHLFLDSIKRRSSAALSRRESFWLQKANTNIFGYGSTINRLPRRGYSWSHPSRYWTDIWKAMEGNKELLRTSLQIQKYVPFLIWHLPRFSWKSLVLTAMFSFIRRLSTRARPTGINERYPVDAHRRWRTSVCVPAILSSGKEDDGWCEWF